MKIKYGDTVHFLDARACSVLVVPVAVLLKKQSDKTCKIEIEFCGEKMLSITLLCIMLRMVNPRGNEENERVNGSDNAMFCILECKLYYSCSIPA